VPLGQRFDAQKAIEAILYVTQRVPDPSFHRISKLLYFADKHKLAASGGLVVGDEYVAMKHGPVPSSVYDLLKCVRGDGTHRAGDAARAAFSVVDRCRVSALRDANNRYFSSVDIDSLDFAIREFGRLPFEELTRLSHDAAWQSADENEFLKFEDIARATSNPERALAAVRDRFSVAV
jgi:uncharacterized phage-associated protein